MPKQLFALTGDKDKAIEAGCNDYISKPIKECDLELIIQKHFENHKKLDNNQTPKTKHIDITMLY